MLAHVYVVYFGALSRDSRGARRASDGPLKHQRVDREIPIRGHLIILTTAWLSVARVHGTANCEQRASVVQVICLVCLPCLSVCCIINCRARLEVDRYESVDM